MRWALKRQFLFALGILAILGALAFGIWVSFFYHAPSCFDNKQNGDETGVDCGGGCARICQVPTVTALWARSVEAGTGVFHAVALVRNPRSDAGTTALPYHFSLYDVNNILVAERRGTMYLEPGEVAPLFEGDIVTGSRTPVRTYVDFGPATWEKMPAPAVAVSVDAQTSPADITSSLTLSAHVTNLTALPLPPTVVTALLYGADGNLVNASQTVVTGLPARGEKNIVFTWQTPFANPVTRIELTPRPQAAP